MTSLDTIEVSRVADLRANARSISAAIACVQDIMRLDNSARMNLPGSTTNNWSWRMGDNKVWAKLNKHTDEIQMWLKDYDRTQETTVI